MNSTRIIVIQLKELIVTVLFSVAGVILLGILIYIFIPKDKTVDESSIYIPGKYTSTITLGDKNVEVEVSVNDSKITSIEFLDLDSQQEIFYPLLQPTMSSISKEIIDKQSLDISMPSDSEVTGNAILKAIEEALNKAKIEK